MIDIKVTNTPHTGYHIRYYKFGDWHITQEVIDDLMSYNAMDLESELINIFKEDGASEDDAKEIIRRLKTFKTG